MGIHRDPQTLVETLRAMRRQVDISTEVGVVHDIRLQASGERGLRVHAAGLASAALGTLCGQRIAQPVAVRGFVVCQYGNLGTSASRRS